MTDTYQAGDHIEYRQGSRWFSGTIERPNYYLSHHWVVRADHDLTRLIDPDEIRPISTHAFQLGDKVEFPYFEKGWLKATVVGIRNDKDGHVEVTIRAEDSGLGTFPINAHSLRPIQAKYKIGQEVEFKNIWDVWVPAKIIDMDENRPIEVEVSRSDGGLSYFQWTTAEKLRPKSSGKFSVGQEVEYFATGVKEWYPATVLSSRPGVVHIQMKSAETDIDEKHIRPRPEKYPLGTKVEWLESSTQKWRSGVVVTYSSNCGETWTVRDENLGRVYCNEKQIRLPLTYKYKMGEKVQFQRNWEDSTAKWETATITRTETVDHDPSGESEGGPFARYTLSIETPVHDVYNRYEDQLRPIPEPTYKPGDKVEVKKQRSLGETEDTWIPGVVSDKAAPAGYGFISVTRPITTFYTPDQIRPLHEEFKVGDEVLAQNTGDRLVIKAIDGENYMVQYTSPRGEGWFPRRADQLRRPT